MTEYAIMKDGRIIDVVTTGRSLSDVAAGWPEYTVVPLVSVSESVQQAYRYWGERP